MKSYKYIYILMILSMTACAQVDSDSLEEISQRVSEIQTGQATLAARLDAIEAQAIIAAAEPTPVQPTANSQGPADYFTGHQLSDLLANLPAGFIHPLPAESIDRGVAIQQYDQVRIGLVYDQKISAEALDDFAAQMGGELRNDEFAMGGSPGWTVEKMGTYFNIQLLEPGHWYNGYLERDTVATVVYANIPYSDEANMSDWFEGNLFNMADYLLPDSITAAPKEKTVVVDRVLSEGEHGMVSIMTWMIDDPAGLDTIFAHYQEALFDHEWYTPMQDDLQDAVYARLDEKRTINVEVQTWEDGVNTFELTIGY